MQRLLNLPFLVILMGIGAAAMYVPAIHAVSVDDHRVSRAFFYSGTIFLFLTAVVGIATYNNRVVNQMRSHLMVLPIFFFGMPLMLAVPLDEAVRDTPFFNAYFEMLSSLTTTGATLFDDPARLYPSVHLWRALVGWMGGFFVWVTAIAILAPMNLGGFEVLSTENVGSGALQGRDMVRSADTRDRLVRYSGQLLPIYGGLTGLLWLLLTIAGEPQLVAITHAMSTLATSGISPIGGTANAQSGVWGEVFIFAFLIFAISRQTFTLDPKNPMLSRLRGDPEFRLAVVLVAILPLLLFLRHWAGAYEVNDQENLTATFRALWGALFSVMSYLTTTGFVSTDWAEARAWSALPAPGMLLLGLALFGGGVATTAGGVKLLRVYALYKHGMREVDKLVYPNSIGGAGATARHLRRRGAYVAWVFFMLYALTIAFVSIALSLTGMSFEDCMIFTVSALSNTGPLVAVGGENPISYAPLGDVAKTILMFTMVLGRLETLAVIALFNPEFWRS